MAESPTYIAPRSKFDQEEDKRLLAAVMSLGTDDWIQIAAFVPGRNARQCRERWRNYVDPTLIKDDWTEAEDQLLLGKFRDLGSKWDVISTFFQGRSRNNVRNRFAFLQRSLDRMPVTNTSDSSARPASGLTAQPRQCMAMQRDETKTPPKAILSLMGEFQESSLFSCRPEKDIDDIFQFMLSISVK
jgi:hypothetical protein